MKGNAQVLLATLRLGPKSWAELYAGGLDRRAVLSAISDLVDLGQHRIRVGPLLVELEEPAK
jgi:hypothetical protein